MSQQELSERALIDSDRSQVEHDWAKSYRESQSERIDWLRESVDKHHTGGPVVDLGSHPNVLTQRLDDELSSHVIGVDLDPARASAAVRNQLDLRQCDIDDDRVPVGTEQAGTVVCSEVLEHLARPARAISEIHRILMPGGRAILTTPNFGRLETRVRALRGQPPHRLDDELRERDNIGHDGHRQLLSAEEVAGLCEDVGLRVVEHRTVQFWSARSRALDLLYRVYPALRPYQVAVVERGERG